MRPSSPTARGALALAAILALVACSTDDEQTVMAPSAPVASYAITAAPVNTTPELPRAYINTDYVAPTGKRIYVAAGGDLQKAINAALPGDVIELQAGATWPTDYGFYLPNKSGTGWVTIRTSTSDASLPPGVRVRPEDAPKMAKIVAKKLFPAFRTKDGTHNYRIIGLEMTAASSVEDNYVLASIGTGHEAALSAQPRNVILDRVYIHGHPTLNLKRCVALNGSSLAIIDSYLTRCHAVGMDAQAIASWTGPGPYKIVNNYLAGSAEVVLFGGADPAFANVVPGDIEFRRNHVTRPTAWKDVWMIKNIFELKNARRLLVEGNVFKNNWADGQNGYAFVWKSVNQSGKCTWCIVSDVTFRYNKVMRTGGILSLTAKAGSYPAQNAARISITHNVFDQIDTLSYLGTDWVFVLAGPLADVTINHNTIGSVPSFLVNLLGYGTLSRFDFRNNVAIAGPYGVKGPSTASGTASLTTFAPGYVFPRNVIVRKSTTVAWPSDTYYPTTTSGVGFVDAANRNYRLSSSSPYKGKATDGTDPGADIAAVERATANVLSP